MSHVSCNILNYFDNVRGKCEKEHNGVNSKRAHGPNADVIRRYIQQEKKQNSKNNYFILKNHEKTNTKTNKNLTLKINGS